VEKTYSDRGMRKILARYATAAGIGGPISPTGSATSRSHFTWLETEGIDDALIQPYSSGRSDQRRAEASGRSSYAASLRAASVSSIAC
jgi:integrase/recombinase XerD